MAILDGLADPSYASLAETVTHTEGMVRDLAIVRRTGFDRIYSASGPKGVVAFEPGNSQPTLEFSPSIGNVYCVAAMDVDDGEGALTRIVLAGTNDDDTSGQLVAFRHVQGSGLTPFAFYTGLPPVYTMALSQEVYIGGPTLLVGTACGASGSSCGGVWQFYLNTADLLSQASDTLTSTLNTCWNGEPVSGGITTDHSPLFVRDIVIQKDESDPQDTQYYAYVSAHSKGIFKVSLNSHTLLPLGGAWPITEGSAKFKGLALSPDHSYLVAALGQDLQDERQVYGSCTHPILCDSGSTARNQPTHSGVRIYDLVTPGSPIQSVATFSPHPMNAMAVATRPKANGFWIDLSADSADAFLRLDYDGGTTITQTGAFDEDDGILVNTVDSLVTHSTGSQTFLYAGLETGISTHEITGGTLSAPVDYLDGVAVHLRILESSPPYIFGGTLDRVDLFSLANPANPVKASGSIVNGGRLNYHFDAIEAPPAAGHPTPPEQWLIIGNNLDRFSAFNGSGFKIWNVAPVIADTTPAASDAVLVLHHLEEDGQSSGINRKFGGLLARPVDSNHIAVYVVYGPSVTDGPFLGATEAGVAAFKIGYDPSLSPPRYTVDAKYYVPALTGLSQVPEPLGEIHYAEGASSDFIYVGLGCLGTARFSVSKSNPFDVQLDAHRPSPPGRHALYPLEHNGKVYISYLGGMPGVMGVEDAVNFGAGTVTLYDAPMQPAEMIPDPTSQGVNPDSFYLPDFRGGLHRVQFP